MQRSVEGALQVPKPELDLNSLEVESGCLWPIPITRPHSLPNIRSNGEGQFDFYLNHPVPTKKGDVVDCWVLAFGGHGQEGVDVRRNMGWRRRVRETIAYFGVIGDLYLD